MDESTTVKNHKRSKLRLGIRIAAIVVIAIVVVVLCVIGYSYWHIDQVYDEASDIAFGGPVEEALAIEQPAEDVGIEEANAEEQSSEENIVESTEESSSVSESYIDLASVSIDWDALAAVNPDVVGWVYMPDTVINYPVVQGSDNEHYLNYNFDGERATNWTPMAGTPFLFTENAADFSDPVNIIQAHNMANGKMFAAIPKLMNSGFNTHRTAYVFTPTANYRLRSISMVVCSATDPIVRTSFSSREEFDNYINSAVSRSVVSVDPAGPATEDIDKIIILSTCTSDNTNRRCLLVCAVEEAYYYAQAVQEEVTVQEGEAVQEGGGEEVVEGS